MLEAGAVGEMLVARVRIIAALAIFLLPWIAWVAGSPLQEVLTGAVVATAAVLFAAFFLYKVKRSGASVRWRYVTVTFDVSSISLVLAVFLVMGEPHTALNSRVVWELYLISIAATALRGDPRLCVYAGVLAILQYGLINWAATAIYGDLNDPAWAPFVYGHVNSGDQISRLVLMGIATLVALVSVIQTRKLLHLSGVDRLTGLHNRTWLDLRLARELREARLANRQLSLAMVDVDRFKEFNDRHGHLAGDLALRHIARRLQERLAGQALVARFGGEEFTVLFPGLGLDRARFVCEQVRMAFENDQVDSVENAGRLPSPTVSIGLASAMPDEPADTLLARADRALIRAKQTGRNRVVIDRPEAGHGSRDAGAHKVLTSMVLR